MAQFKAIPFVEDRPQMTKPVPLQTPFFRIGTNSGKLINHVFEYSWKASDSMTYTGVRGIVRDDRTLI